MNRIKIIIIAGSVVLIVLIIVSMILARFNNVGDDEQDITNNTKIVETTVLTDTQRAQLITQAKNIPILQEDDVDKLFDLQNKMPYSTADFEMDYSDLTGKFYIHKKTNVADEEINRFLETAGLNNYKSLFEFTNKSTRQSIHEEENKILEIRTDSLSETTDNLEGYAKVKQQNLEHNLSVLQKLFTELASPSTGGTDQLSSLLENDDIESTVSAEAPNQGNANPPNFPPSSGEITLDSIFNEAGLKVGTPPKILRGVMTRECPPLMNISNDLVAQYSTPGNGLPAGHGCFKNSIGASGPMQFMPGTWVGYASAVNRFGGYTHTPYIANIRDSVYGAAWKLKRDSGATSATTWTYDQVRRAVICYNAGCGRLNNPPSSTLLYLEAVWKIYNSS